MFATTPRATVRANAAGLVLTALAALAGLQSDAIAQQVPADALSPLRFRHIGPVGNRIASVAGVVGDPLTYYVGAASGGVWKTTDGGTMWEPVFDDQPSHAIGAMAVSASDPAIVWVGKISYGVYIFHWPLYLLYAKILPPPDDFLIRTLTFFPFLAVLLAISWLSFRYYESIFLKMKDRGK